MKITAPLPENPSEMKERDNGDTELMLRTIGSLRRKFTAAQVNWIRESVLLDGVSSPKMAKKLYPEVSVSSIWALVRGRTYRDVPLSKRLKLAYQRSLRKREVPEPEENERRDLVDAGVEILPD